MRVELASLESGGGKFAHTYAPDELTLGDDRLSFASITEVSGRIRRDELKVAVVGDIKTRLRLECDRCLKPLETPVSTTFELEYVTPDTYEAGHAAELLKEDLTLAVFDGAAIDVDEIVREQLLLALPAQTLCDDACKGLCPVCGGDRNAKDCNCEEIETDPRWAGLKEIANRES